MKNSLRSTIYAGAAVAALTAGAALAPAASAAPAAKAPKYNSTCAIGGQTAIVNNKVYVCTSATEGAKPRWGYGARVTTSPLTITDGWAKAADDGTSAAFGMLKNPTDKPITVIGAASPYAKAVQLHEVVMKDGSMVMQQKEGGFTIPANGMIELKPGGNHLMFMGISRPIKPGTMVPVKLITEDGGVFRTKVMAKVFAGANETYDGGMSDMKNMSGM